MTKLLIVDDDKPNLYMLRVLFERRGYQVETAVNGQDALEKAQHAPPAMIISDILMPVMDGFGLCRRWIQDEQLRNIPFIFYTANYTDPKDKDLALSLGAARFFDKLTEPDELVEEIKALFEEKENGRSLSPLPLVEDEPIFLAKYNERLINKLEDKMVQLEQANRHLKVLYWASSNLTAIKPMKELISHVLRTIIEAMGYAKANYFTFDTEKEQFHLLDAIEYPPEAFKKLQNQMRFHLGEARGLVGLVGQSKQPLIIPETNADPRWINIDKTLHSALFVPVIHEGILLGVLGMFSTEPDAFTQDHARDMMTLSNNIAIAIENAQLYEAQQQYTARLEAEVAARTAELQVALEKANAADKLKSQFVSDMNHELRTPLTVIKLYLGLLDHGRPENWSRYIETLVRETERLQTMVDELLDLSQLDLGKTTTNIATVDLNYIIGNLIMDRGALVAEKGLTLDFEPESSLPAVLADQQLLFQVLTNLLANAINYTTSGGITICTGTAVADNKTWVKASVADTGPGISDTDKKNLFERFFRGEVGRESGAPGTGLGLAICQEIMDRIGGRISVESELGQGSKFIIWLQPANQSA